MFETLYVELTTMQTASNYFPPNDKAVSNHTLVVNFGSPSPGTSVTVILPSGLVAVLSSLVTPYEDDPLRKISCFDPGGTPKSRFPTVLLPPPRSPNMRILALVPASYSEAHFF